MNFTLSKLAGWFFTAAGVVTLLSSLISYFHTRSDINAAAKADGVIIRFVQGYSANVRYPVYGFQKPDGRWQEVFTDVIATHRTNGKPGDKVSLIYQAGHLDEAKPYTYWNVWARTVRMCLSGALALLFGLGVLFVSRTG